jgi:zinc transport system substrate-binding protein
MHSWMKWGGGVVAIVLLLWGGWFVESSTRSLQEERSLAVAATFFPIADFARSIGFDEVAVHQIVPDGVEPHEYEPSPSDVVNMLSADVVLINGGGVDAWAEKLIPDIQANGGLVVRMDEVAPFVALAGDDQGGTLDPHAWLDPARAQEMVRAIAEAFIAKDEAHVATYAMNADTLRTELQHLDSTFSETLASCASRTVLVTHDAFQYWALRYNLSIEAVTGVSPDVEPSVRDLAELTERAKELEVTTIFFESPASTALASTLAAEVGASVDVLSPLEGRTNEEIKAAATYTTIMEKNLEALAKALTCTR